jgi:hypothetical protein
MRQTFASDLLVAIPLAYDIPNARGDHSIEDLDQIGGEVLVPVRWAGGRAWLSLSLEARVLDAAHAIKPGQG